MVQQIAYIHLDHFIALVKNTKKEFRKKTELFSRERMYFLTFLGEWMILFSYIEWVHYL